MSVLVFNNQYSISSFFKPSVVLVEGKEYRLKFPDQKFISGSLQYFVILDDNDQTVVLKKKLEV